MSWASATSPLALQLPLSGHRPGVAVAIVLVLVVCAAYVAWHLDPAHVICAALVASLFSGNWKAMHFPNSLPPDRLLMLAGIALVLVRAPAAADRPALRIRMVHVLLFLAGLYALASAAFAGTLTHSSSLFRLTDRLGLVPFALFAIAPLAFRTDAQRRALLGTLVGIGLYLGVIALLETTGPKALILPSYITNPEAGLHFGRARGPFLEAQTMGLALFGCGVASAVAFRRWRSFHGRLIALATMALCTAGLLFTLERAIWVGAALAVVVTMLMVRELRRWALPVLGVAAILMACLVAFVPGMSSRVHDRITSTNAQRSGWDRQNLNSAAVRMAEAHPLFGVGWNEFTERAEPYLRTSPDFPMTGAINGTGTVQVVHNAFLSNAAELGLIGTFLWCAALAGVFFGAVFQRYPPELRPWRIGLLAMAIMWVVVSNLIPLSKPFPTLLLFLWAGLAYEPGVALAPVPVRRRLVKPAPAKPVLQ